MDEDSFDMLTLIRVLIGEIGCSVAPGVLDWIVFEISCKIRYISSLRADEDPLMVCTRCIRLVSTEW